MAICLGFLPVLKQTFSKGVNQLDKWLRSNKSVRKDKITLTNLYHQFLPITFDVKFWNDLQKTNTNA